MRRYFNTKRKLDQYDGLAILQRVERSLRNQFVCFDHRDYRARDKAIALIAWNSGRINPAKMDSTYGRSCAA